MNVNASNGYGAVASGTFQFGNDPYKYPDNLPIIGAKGWTGWQTWLRIIAGCLERTGQWRQLVTNTGWGTGLDWRPQSWQSGFRDGPILLFPSPAQCRSRRVSATPADPLPVPHLLFRGDRPYGAPWYAPDGTPLFSGGCRPACRRIHRHPIRRSRLPAREPFVQPAPPPPPAPDSAPGPWLRTP